MNEIDLSGALLAEYLAVGMGLAGNALVAHKRRGGFVLWILSNAILIPLVWGKGMLGLMMLYGIYTVLAGYSFWQWGRPEATLDGDGDRRTAAAETPHAGSATTTSAL